MAKARDNLRSTLTADEIAARIEASLAKRQPVEKINNEVRLRDSGLRIVHLLPSLCYNKKGMTVAYRPADKPVMEISTALCKRGDVFSRKMGTKTAIENFQSGRTVFIPVDFDGPVNTIKASFSL